MATAYFECVDVGAVGSVWNTCIYTQILNTFYDALSSGLTSGVIGASLQLLSILGAMEIAVLVAWMAMSDDDQFIADIFCKLIRVGIYAQLIANVMPWGLEFANGAMTIGLLLSAPASMALGLPPLTLDQLHDPGALMYSGFRLFTPLITYIENLGLVEVVVWHSVTALLYGLIAIGGVACIFWIGLNLLVGWVELLLLLAFGTPLIALTIFEYTRWMAMGPMSTMVAAALRLGIYALLAGLIFPVLSVLQVTDAGDPGWDTVFALLGVSLLSGYLSYRAHALASQITGGQSAYTGAGIVMMARQSSQVVQQLSGVGAALSQVAQRLHGSMPARTARS